MRLRGYDEYEVTLGDEMRGERASLGKTLHDAERELRIKAHVIRAIEDCDLDEFPNDSVIAGYVRSYARYLGMDSEDCYLRFCAESGFRSPVSALGGDDLPASGGGLQNIVAAGAAFGTGLGQSRFAAKSGPVRLSARVNLGGLTSMLAMLALLVGLGYGGYALLQDIQRVGIAPLPEAPDVVAEAPLITPPTIDGGLLRRPDADAYQGDGVLAATAPSELPPPTRQARDGPISAIDPATSGVYRDLVRDRDPALSNGAATDVAAADPRLADPRLAGPVLAERVLAESALPENVPAGPPKITIHATDTAWIRVRDSDEAVVFQGTLAAGGRFEIPERVIAPMLRAGNAGAVYVLVDDAPYGPVGSSNRVVKELSLLAADIESRMPQANSATIGIEPGNAAQQRAEAVLPQ